MDISEVIGAEGPTAAETLTQSETASIVINIKSQDILGQMIMGLNLTRT